MSLSLSFDLSCRQTQRQELELLQEELLELLQTLKQDQRFLAWLRQRNMLLDVRSGTVIDRVCGQRHRVADIVRLYRRHVREQDEAPSPSLLQLCALPVWVRTPPVCTLIVQIHHGPDGDVPVWAVVKASEAQAKAAAAREMCRLRKLCWYAYLDDAFIMYRAEDFDDLADMAGPDGWVHLSADDMLGGRYIVPAHAILWVHQAPGIMVRLSDAELVVALDGDAGNALRARLKK